MRENTNKSIAVNSIILYIKLIIVTLTGLLTTRFSLKALGVTEFGLFSVLGSIITFISIFNTIMISTSNRFISIAIGKGEISKINEQFNVNLVIHVIIAIVTLFIIVPLGDLYIYNCINYDGPIAKAIWVFNITVLGSIISFIGVPYHGMLIAKERFIVFSSVDIIIHIIRTLVAYLLIFYGTHKLIIYSLTQSVIVALPTVVYLIYCNRKFPEIVKIKLCKDIHMYKDVLSFSGWIAFGAFAFIGKSQGAALLVNAFFNTIINTALGVANTVGSMFSTFVNCITQPIAPQISKSYARGDSNRCNDLLIMSTKYPYLALLCIAIPFLTESNYILGLWLGEVPKYVNEFVALIVIDTLITSMNSGISNLIFANGNIKLYQISINSLRFLSIGGAYIMLRLGGEPYSLLLSYIFFSIIIFFVGQWVLHKTLGFDNRILWRNSYLPSLLVTLVVSPVFFVKLSFHPIINIIIYELSLVIVIAVIGLSKNERNTLLLISKRLLYKLWK